ncbi:MAG TPA: transposase [Rhodoblastus sp.]|nr:transposase [Rhodoblastus sp.]
MAAEPKGWHSRGFLPHFDSPERVQHIVFRAKDSLPAAVLLAWCIMPNHVHVVCEPIEGSSIGSIIRSWKAFTAAAINRQNGSTGPVWARDYFDRYARSEDDVARIVGYVENNPVKAGLAGRAEDWPWSSTARRAQERA